MAESFVDTFKTELIADRVWRTRSQLELAIVEYIAWFNKPAYTKTSPTVHPARSKNSTL
jgi:putative transposase